MVKNAGLRAAATAWLAAAVVFAGIFVIENHIHDHTGDTCRVCLEINIAVRLIEAFGRLGAGCLPACFLKYVGEAARVRRCFFPKRPMELKVRFNC